MAEKTTVAVRFTKHLLDVRMEGFVNALGHLIVHRLKEKRTAKDAFKDWKIQWMRIPPEEECTYAIIIWGKHETVEVREVVCEVARDCAAQQLSVVLDIVME